MSVAKSMTQISGSFSVNISDRWRQENAQWPLKPGKNVGVYVGKQQIINGYIDSLNANFDASTRTITLTGRDKTGDLVDCSVIDPPGEFRGLNLQELAKRFLSPFGIQLKVETDIGAAFDPFTIKQGESVFEALSRAAKIRGVLLISDENGDLVLTRRGSRKSNTALVQGVNILKGSVNYDNSKRFSNYFIKGQTAGTDEFHGKNAASSRGTAQDTGIVRYRPLLVIGETSLNTTESQKRAEWEASVRAAEGVTLDIEVAGWQKRDGTLWKVNELVDVDCKMLGITSEMLMNNITFTKSNSGGTVSQMSLGRQDAFEPESVIEKENDPIEKLGWKDS